jgi:hypothetical protein
MVRSKMMTARMMVRTCLTLADEKEESQGTRRVSETIRAKESGRNDRTRTYQKQLESRTDRRKKTSASGPARPSEARTRTCKEEKRRVGLLLTHRQRTRLLIRREAHHVKPERDHAVDHQRHGLPPIHLPRPEPPHLFQLPRPPPVRDALDER